MEDIKTEYENEDFQSDYKINVQDIKNDVTDAKVFEASDIELSTLERRKNLDNNNRLNEKITQETIFLNNVKKEFVDYFCCENCNEEYELYCSKCSMLSHVLDDTILRPTHNNAKRTIPKNILYVDDSVDNAGVYALKTIPESVIFGPFFGLNSSNDPEPVWRVKDGKLILKEDNSGFSNWMQFVNCAKHISQQNLEIFQHNNRLYYRSNRKISNGEELLVYFGDEHINNLENNVRFLTPVIEEVVQNVYACTYCCLGFSSNTYLLKHKSRCLNGFDMKFLSEDIVRCENCSLYMVKAEYSECHMYCCAINYTRYEKPKLNRINVETTSQELKQKENIFVQNCDAGNKEHIASNNYLLAQNFVKKYGCDKCTYRSDTKSYLIEHFLVHQEERPFACNICDNKYKRKRTLRQHMRNIHSGTKNLKCTKCSYQTCYKTSLSNHLHTHDDVKSFVCKLCDKRFTTKQVFKVHVRKFHPDINDSECESSKDDPENDSVKFIRTDTEATDERVGGSIKPSERREETGSLQHSLSEPYCLLCKKVFSATKYLKKHIRFRHTDQETFCCSKCDYQTRYKGNLRTHLNTVHVTVKGLQCSHCPYKTTVEVNLRRHMHIHDIIKPFKCDKCGKEFSRNYTLIKHVREKHSECHEKKFKCSNCDYRTNCKTSFNYHQNTHEEVKSFLCEICSKGFTRKCTLVKHKKAKHSSDEDKYKCPKCSYRTSRRYAIKTHHMCVHEGLKPFICEICNIKFARKSNLTNHNRAIHKDTHARIMK